MAAMKGTLVASLLFGLLRCAVADPAAVLISNAKGIAHAANGLYAKDQDFFNEHYCYKKDKVQLWLCMDSNYNWNVQVKNMRGGNRGILVSTVPNAPSPLEAGPWKVFDKTQNQWAEDDTVRVTSVLPTAIAPPQAGAMAKDAQVLVAGAQLRQTVATMLFGTFAMAMVSLALAGSTDPHMRSYFFKLLSATVTFLMSLLVSLAVWELLFDQILPAEPPFGFGLGYEIKDGVKIVISFAIFTLSYMSLNFFGWKFQFSRPRLYVVRTLGSHMCACFALGTFTLIQDVAINEASHEFEGPLLDPQGARIFSALLVIVVAWVTFALYRSAGIGAREELFKQPPVKPWPAPSNPPVPAAPAAQTRPASCTSMSWGTQPPPMMKKAPGPDWGSFVNAAEDEACVVTLGYLVNQFLAFLVTGESPGLKAHYSVRCDWLEEFWAGSILGFLVLLLIILAIRSRFGDGGRLGSIINRTVAMALAWCIYRATRWATMDLLKDNHPLLGVEAAFVVSALSVVMLILLDKLLDYILGRNGSPALRRAMGHFHDSDDVPLSERGMRIIMNCMGLLMALSWETAISFSVDTLVKQSPVPFEFHKFAAASFCIVVALMMLFPWRRIILPTSEMSERHLEETIKHELLQMDKAEDFMPVSVA